MARPKSTSMLLASTWLTHAMNETAWDAMRDIVENDPFRAWRIVRAIVGCARDYSVLSAVAAGPVEDLISRHGDTMIPVIAADAEVSARVRICLRATYSDFPAALSALVEGETADVRDLAVESEAALVGEDLALAVAWLHHSDAAWSSEFITAMTENDPAAAWDVLRVLAVFAEEDRRVRDDVFERAFEPFIRRHFSAYREQLVLLGRKSAAFREWARGRKPRAIEASIWAAFVKDLESGRGNDVHARDQRR